MVDCLRDLQDPTGSSPGFQAQLTPRPITMRLAGGLRVGPNYSKKCEQIWHKKHQNLIPYLARRVIRSKLRTDPKMI